MNNDTTTQVIHTREETEFMIATQAWKARTGRTYPTWSETQAEIKKLSVQSNPNEEAEFQTATQAWCNRTGRKFPTWSEVLGIAKSLGYQKQDPVEGPVNC